MISSPLARACISSASTRARAIRDSSVSMGARAVGFNPASRVAAATSASLTKIAYMGTPPVLGNVAHKSKLAAGVKVFLDGKGTFVLREKR